MNEYARSSQTKAPKSRSHWRQHAREKPSGRQFAVALCVTCKHILLASLAIPVTTELAYGTQELHLSLVGNTKALMAADPQAGAVLRLSVKKADDAPPLLFHYSGAPCPARHGKGDIGTEVPALDHGCWIAFTQDDLDVREFGAVCNGSTDDANAIMAADTAAIRVRASRVLFPAGTCAIRSTISIPDYVTWQGTGPVQTTVLVTYPAGDAIVAHTAIQLRDLGFATAPQISRTGGAFVTFTGSGDTLNDFTMRGYVIGVRISGRSPADPAITTTVSNGKFFEPSVAAPNDTVAVYADNFSSASLTDLTMSGYQNSSAPAHSIEIKGGDTIFLANINATLHGTFAVSPDVNQNAYAVRISNALFDSAGVGTGMPGINACIVGGAGGIFDTEMSNVWCSLSTGTGLLIAPEPGGTVSGLQISNIETVGNHSNGITTVNTGLKIGTSSGGAVSGVSIEGGCSSGNINTKNESSAWAVWIDGPVSDVAIGEFAGTNCDDRGKNSNGLKISSRATKIQLNGLNTIGNAGVQYSGAGVR